ncbi:hypothetical protein H0H87_012008 [Tephrocybe sp. NHM501043]|nr:hypothetical protein H0H87_012008 [Tephrocybe sp. NHM501043]
MTTSAVDTSTAKPEEAPLSFSAWFKNQTEALYGVNSQEGSPNSSIPEMFSDNAQIVVNDESFTADEFKKTLSSRTRFTRQNSLSWKDISVTTPDEDGTKEAVVVGTFIHTRSLNFRIRAGPAQLKTAVTFRAKYVWLS